MRVEPGYGKNRHRGWLRAVFGGCCEGLWGCSACWVVFGGEAGDGFDTWLTVSGEGARVDVTAFRHEQRERRFRFAEVCEG